VEFKTLSVQSSGDFGSPFSQLFKNTEENIIKICDNRYSVLMRECMDGEQALNTNFALYFENTQIFKQWHKYLSLFTISENIQK
jgi:hypothetical protein